MFTKLKKAVSFAFINLLVVAILLITINWGVGEYLAKTKNRRASLPNFEGNQEYSAKIFYDYNKIKHQYEPFVGWKTLAYSGETTNIDESGHRITPGTINKHDTLKKVRFFGGSTMWGEGSDDHNTIPALYASTKPDHLIYNHGQLAYNTRQNLDALITLYQQNEKSDIVIFYDGVNDAAFLCASDVEVPGHRLVPIFRQRLYVSNKKFILKVVEKLFYENIIKLIARKNPAIQSKLYDCLNEDKADRIANFLIKNWEIAQQIVESNGGEFIAFLQPAAYIGNPKTDHLDLDKELEKNFIKVYEKIRLKLREKDYDWVYDLTDSFDKDEYIYVDFCHVSPNGNAIIAERISQIIKSKD
ncbi:MAG: hypothetical protein AAF363_14530 [Bacteroidota bacterium]